MGRGRVRVSRFLDDVRRSEGVNAESDIEAIELYFEDQLKGTRMASDQEQRLGVDYIAELLDGAEVCIDAKRRIGDCKKYWRGAPEVPLEIFSVCPSKGKPDGILGWSLSTSKRTDYVLYSFEPSVCSARYFFPFQALRVAFWRRGGDWRKRFKSAKQRTKTTREGRSVEWESMCVFVPVDVLWAAIMADAAIEPIRA